MCPETNSADLKPDLQCQSPILRGVLPVIPTLFTNGNQIDIPAQKEVVRFALRQGASAVVCPAVASEYNLYVN